MHKQFFQGLPGDKGMTGPPGPHGMSVSKIYQHETEIHFPENSFFMYIFHWIHVDIITLT